MATPKPMVVVFLTIISSDGTRQICLPFGKTKFNKGKRNGYGGKLDPGETALAAARRELEEESGVDAPWLSESDLAARIVVTWPDDKEQNFGAPGTKLVELFVYLTELGDDIEPNETNEMEAPEWFDVDRLPFDQMHPGEKLWLPEILDGKYMFGEMTCRADGSVIESNIYSGEQTDKTHSCLG